MASEAEKQFLSFDWSGSPEWQKYFSDLYPTPPASRVFYFKKKWFKAHMNEDLSLDFPGDQPPPSTQGRQPTRPAPPPTGAAASKPSAVHRNNNLTSLSLLLLVFGLFWTVAYILPIGVRNAFRWASFCFLGGFGVDVVATHGLPQFNSAYWQQVLLNDSGQAVFMSLAGLGLQSWLVLVSPAMTSIFLFSKTASSWVWIVPNSMKASVNQWVTYISTKTYQLMQMRANFEVMVGLSAILMIFTRMGNLITCLLYWNALRLRYQASAFTQSTFRQMDGTITRLLGSPYCPAVVAKGYGFIRSQLSNLVATTAP